MVFIITNHTYQVPKKEHFLQLDTFQFWNSYAHSWTVQEKAICQHNLNLQIKKINANSSMNLPLNIWCILALPGANWRGSSRIDEIHHWIKFNKYPRCSNKKKTL